MKVIFDGINFAVDNGTVADLFNAYKQHRGERLISGCMGYFVEEWIATGGLDVVYSNRVDNPTIAARIIERRFSEYEYDLQLRARIKRMNAFNAEINSIAPILIDEIKKGVKLKTDGSLYAKEKERFDAITCNFNVNVSYRLERDFVVISTKNGRYHLYIERGFIPLRTDFTYGEYKRDMKKIKTLEEKERNIQRDIRGLKYKWEF